MVACGDEDTNQLVIWDVDTEKVFARLNGQSDPILQVRYSAKLARMVTVSAATCCIYGDVNLPLNQLYGK
jgi:hypothetical protein